MHDLKPIGYHETMDNIYNLIEETRYYVDKAGFHIGIYQSYPDDNYFFFVGNNRKGNHRTWSIHKDDVDKCLKGDGEIAVALRNIFSDFVNKKQSLEFFINSGATYVSWLLLQ